MGGMQIIDLFKMEQNNMKALIVSFFLLILAGCINSKDYSDSPSAQNLFGKCYEFTQPTFVFESRCADIDGNDNSTICLGVQVAGDGGFPTDMQTYSSNMETIDTQLFDRLAFEDQRHISFLVNSGTQVKLTKLIHHGWGTIGQYWILRGDLTYQNRQYQVEIPSLDLIHNKPLWFDARANMMPSGNSIQNLKECS